MNSSPYKSVKELRKAFCLTQREMGFFIGISVRNYREKEQGHIPFSQLEIMKMILIFDLTPDDVYSLFYIKGINDLFWKRNIGHFDESDNLLKMFKEKQKQS